MNMVDVNCIRMLYDGSNFTDNQPEINWESIRFFGQDDTGTWYPYDEVGKRMDDPRFIINIIPIEMPKSSQASPCERIEPE